VGAPRFFSQKISKIPRIKKNVPSLKVGFHLNLSEILRSLRNSPEDKRKIVQIGDTSTKFRIFIRFEVGNNKR